uniref:ARAD1A01562p n=1 Tax=Blastobotrys adeninivorans TaxID=409370 RepID=A0A060T1N0_BLAAD
MIRIGLGSSLRCPKAPLCAGLKGQSQASVLVKQLSTFSVLRARMEPSGPKPIRPVPKRKGIDLSPLERAKEKFDNYNKDPKFKRKAAIVLIGFYLVTALFGIRYLYETKHRATGEPSKNKSLEEALKEAEEMTGQDTTAVYDGLAEEYDSKIRWEEFLSSIWLRRRQLMKHVSGDALEVSCGTGRNVPYLHTDKVTSLTFVDSSTPMLQVAKAKFDKKYGDFHPVQFVQGKAEDLVAIASKSGQKFDTVFESFGLCSHENPDLALQNFGKLLKPGGKIVLLEHGRSTNDSMNRRMDEKAERRAKEWGCRWNLDIKAIVERSGLEIVEEERFHFGTTYFYVLKPKGSGANSSTSS